MKAIRTVSPFCASASPDAAAMADTAITFNANFIVVSWLGNSWQGSCLCAVQRSGIAPKELVSYRVGDMFAEPAQAGNW
jgi:hypothetical protein